MESLPTLNAADLTTPVRQLLHDNSAEITTWQVKQMGGGVGNPVSAGLYRCSGTAEANGRSLPWSLVLKITQSPVQNGYPDLAHYDDPSSWSYWQRESLLFRSDLLSNLPTSLAAPRCLGIVEQPNGRTWLWLEEITDAYNGVWPFEQFLAAAQAFGRFNGIYLNQPLPAAPWLGRNFLRQWCAMIPTIAPGFYQPAGQSDLWEHPLARSLFPPAEANPLRLLLLNKDPYLDALDRLPHTFCHQDAYAPSNLMARHRADGQLETVAIDWALAGLAPIGAELSQLTVAACDTLRDSEPAAISQALFTAYLDGLRQSGWQGSEQEVHFGYMASAALRAGQFLLFALNHFIQTAPTDPAAIAHLPNQARLLLDIAAELLGHS